MTVFEFGTYLGFTTAFFSDYLAERAGTNRVFTLDLDSPQSVHFEGNDAALAHTVLDRPRLHTQIGAASVQELRMDSPLFRPERYDLVGQVQFCLVDANHALSYVEHDTKQALAMRDSNRPSVIVWDDYRHPDFPDLTSFLDSLTSSVPNLFHIEETNLAVAFPRGMTIPERVSGIRL